MNEDKKSKILCVDDEPRNLQLLEALLAPRGYALELAESGEKALAKAAESAPDLVLLDIMMPKMSGYEVLKKLREEEKFRLIPVIMITALQETEDKVKALDLGCDDFVSKPFDKGELLARIRAMLKINSLRRELAEKERTEKMEREFLSMVSHELKTPLTPINGYITLFLNEQFGPLTPEYKKAARLIQQEGKHLLGLIDSVLDVTRIETARMGELDKEPLSVRFLINDVLEVMAPQFKEREMTVEAALPENFPTVQADAVKLRRVITNLLGNAVKFTPQKGGVKITGEEVSGQVLIRVVDSGLGIAKENLEKVFEKFYQVDNTYTRTAGGLGLGLTIAREIIEAHGGKMWAESDGLGKGSRFCFTLPII